MKQDFFNQIGYNQFMDQNWCSLSKKQREELIKQEQKQEFENLCKHYFETFMWSWNKNPEGIFVRQLVPGAISYKLMVILSPYESYPSKKELKNLLSENNLLIVSPEFSPVMSVSKKITAHTASGINFVYLPKIS